MEAMMELQASGRYVADNGFKPGYPQAIHLMDVSLPNLGLQAYPHIKFRLKTLKGNFGVMHDMVLGSSTSGFGWDPDKCVVVAPNDVWDAYIFKRFGVGNVLLLLLSNLLWVSIVVSKEEVDQDLVVVVVVLIVVESLVREKQAAFEDEHGDDADNLDIENEFLCLFNGKGSEIEFKERRWPESSGGRHSVVVGIW
ncbi:putative reverse transcriptase domain-containing protein [Tanacetum coccineum]